MNKLSELSLADLIARYNSENLTDAELVNVCYELSCRKHYKQ